MPVLRVNGAPLHYEVAGEGAPLVLVHGSWDDATTWARVASALACRHRVVAYDRRGHSRSGGGGAAGTLEQDADDLASLMTTLELTPAHVASSSLGGNVALRLAGAQPALFASLAVHEPPLFGLLEDDPEAGADLAAVRGALAAVRAALEDGDHEGGARLFVERVAFGPGAWSSLSRRLREMFVANAPTFLDEMAGGDQQTLELAPLGAFDRPVLLTCGTVSPAYFHRALEHLRRALACTESHVFAGAGHVPHATHPRDYIDVVTDFVRRAEGRLSARVPCA